MTLIFNSVFIIDEHSSNPKSQITREPYVPSNIIRITCGGWLNSDEKWFLSSEKDCCKEHVMLCTWPSGIIINLTEREGTWLISFFFSKMKVRGTGPKPGSKGDKFLKDKKLYP